MLSLARFVSGAAQRVAAEVKSSSGLSAYLAGYTLTGSGAASVTAPRSSGSPRRPFLAEGLDEPLGPLVGSGVIQGLVLMCRTPRVR